MPLPRTLLCLIHAWLVLAQPPQLSLNQVYNFSATTLPNPPAFSLPASGTSYISVALCSSSTPPRFFVTNDTNLSLPGPSDQGQPNVYEIVLQSGFGGWVGTMNVSGVLAVSGATQQTLFEVAVSNTGLIHEELPSLPLLGDTTSNQAFLFSPPFAPSDDVPLTFPNYTLPPANLTFPNAPSLPPDFSIFVVPSTSAGLTTLPRTGCALSTTQINGSQYIPSSGSQGLWMRDSDGWRWQWMLNFLVPLTNYTVYAVQNDTKVHWPINFVTKSVAFSCPIIHSLSFCPSVAYAAPLALPEDPTLGLTAADLSGNVTAPLLSALANFTTMLTTLACGRDNYSPLVTCADCQAAYRTWLCLVSLPRCGEYPSLAASSSFAAASPTAQRLLPALQAVGPSSPPRNADVAQAQGNYTALLPCLETCHAVDRACPPFLGFRCPVRQFTAADSYGVGYVDSGWAGEMGGGSTGTSADAWGNVWCNA